MKGGKILSGVRDVPTNNEFLVQKDAWKKASDKIGRMLIDNVTVEPLTGDHPDVVDYILKQKRYL